MVTKSTKVLIIAPQYVGDSVLTIPFIRELKKSDENLKIDLISQGAGYFIFKECPYLREVFDRKNLNITLLKNERYSKAYILKRSLSAAILAKTIGIKETIGFGGQFREPLLSKVVKYCPADKHELEHFLDVLYLDRVRVADKSLEYFTNETALNLAKNFVVKDRKNILVTAKSSTTVKEWKAEYFAAVVQFLIKNNCHIFFLGLESEKPYYDKIIGFLDNDKHISNLCGGMKFDEMSALVSLIDGVVGIDTGLNHLAAAFGKKVLTLFGPTSKKQWAPIGENCRTFSLQKKCSPCAKPKNCRYGYACMNEILPSHLIVELGYLFN